MGIISRVRSVGVRRLVPLAAALLLPSCGWDGHLCLLGYTTRPNYNMDIRTVYVPIFENRTFRRGIEFQVTQAVIREIEAKTPYKVVSNCDCADTELVGVIASMTKSILNANQLNEVREAQTVLTVDVYWRDLRSGEVLSSPRVPNGEELLPVLPPSEPPEPAAQVKPRPRRVQAIGRFIPELGESITTAEQMMADRVAVQIVSMMEAPW